MGIRQPTLPIRPGKPEKPLLLDFAVGATQNVRDISRKLASEPGIKAFCSTFWAELDQASRFLSESKKDKTAESTVLKLLENLERIFLWPSRSHSSYKSRASKHFDPTWFPILREILCDEDWAKKKLKSFASDPAAKYDRLKLRRSLKAFESSKDAIKLPELSDVLQKTQQRATDDDYQVYIRDLYSTLASNCLCEQEGAHTRITVNLRLGSARFDEKDPNGVHFSLLFLDHPHRHDSYATSHWQDTQICVFRHKAVKFGPSAEKPLPAPGSHAIVSNEDFCRIITNRNQSRLLLVAQGGGLTWRGSGPLMRNFFLRSSSVPLSKILEDPELSKKMRLLLACQLAKAAWQFYDSDWMQEEWNKDSVHFMLERRSKVPKAIFVSEPFLSAKFEHSNCHNDQKLFRSHKFPKILALGVMLLEIELGTKIEDHYRPECYNANGEPSINASHVASMEIYSDSELWEEKDTFGPFKELIGVCLKADPFNEHLNNPQQVRDALYEHVVGPLREFYEKAWESPEKTDIRPLKVKWDGPDENTAQVSQQCDSEGRQPTEGPFAETLSSLTNAVSGASYSSPSSDQWFKQLDKLNTATRIPPRKRDSSCEPAKIAILDTGLRPSFSALAYEDFVDEANEASQDGSGHGTSAFQLLQRVYSDAQIFVGRVWRTNRASDNTASLMAKAIRHAITKWGVDIIVMPSGFQTEHEDMLRAIEEANAAHILIFAAASNHGNLIDITFPARLYRAGKLFCMFSTDVNARSLPAFNPSPLPGANSFAILGENITLGNNAPLSGTSFSAVIAAALAGRIIDFSRHPDTRDLIRRPGHLKRVEGMASVFGKMARTDNSYRCIAPWRLLPQMEDEDLLDPVNRSQVRRHVCEAVSRALEEVYG